MGRHEIAHGSFSSRRELLAQQKDRDGLTHSDTFNTFITTRERNSAILQSPDAQWDPFESSPTARVLDRRHPALSGVGSAGTARLPSNLRSSSSRFGKQGRPAVVEQYEMHSLRMRVDSGPGRLTDDEMVAREEGWTNFPASRVVPGAEPKLVPHVSHLEQTGISTKYLTLSAIIPFGPLAFGLGGFDRVIVRKTHGRITTMAAKQKKRALWLYFPMQMLFLLIVGIVVGVVVGLNRR